MSRFNEEKPKSFTEFVSLVEKIQERCHNELWYRGCGKSKYKLNPSLYRHKTKRRINELIKLEFQLMSRFRQRSIPFHNRALDNDWETLFFMQHHRIPTRLLDWTESPFIALYFAVMSAEFDEDKMKFTNPVAVWILDPLAWNRHALKNVSFDQGVLSINDDQIKGYKPTDKFTGMPEFPVAVYGTHNSPRIVAQRGVFIIFGQNMSPIEKLYDSKNFPANCLIKITINKSKLLKIRKAILNYGITESVVFPDLEGLAKEIRRTLKFEE